MIQLRRPVPIIVEQFLKSARAIAMVGDSKRTTGSAFCIKIGKSCFQAASSTNVESLVIQQCVNERMLFHEIFDILIFCVFV